MICELHRRADGAGALILCGVRASRKRCAFCRQRATVQCDGDRCIRQLCDDHRWRASPEFDLCPPCEARAMFSARMPVQIGLFG